MNNESSSKGTIARSATLSNHKGPRSSRKDDILKRFFSSFALVVVASILAVQPALAARIYNFLPIHIQVVGHVGYATNVAPGQRSESIGWPAAFAVTVHASGTSFLPLCSLGFKGHAEIQGGNYMTVGHHGSQFVCTVCDSNHQAIVSNTGAVVNTDGLFDLKKHPASRTGC